MEENTQKALDSAISQNPANGGHIQFKDGDFQGYDGASWKSLTQGSIGGGSSAWQIDTLGNISNTNSGEVEIAGNINVNGNIKADTIDATQGFMPPRMTSQQRDAITNLSMGLIIYNTTSNCLNFYNGVNWNEWCGTCVPQPTTADAGPNNQTQFSDYVLPLSANTPINGIGQWSILQGSGALIDNNNPNTSYIDSSLSVDSTVIKLKWSISNSCGNSEDVVSYCLLYTSPSPRDQRGSRMASSA